MLLPKHCQYDVKESGEPRCLTVAISSKSFHRFVRYRVPWWWLPHLGFLNFSHFIGRWGPEDRDASPIQISSKLVDVFWRYSDFTIFRYDYSLWQEIPPQKHQKWLCGGKPGLSQLPQMLTLTRKFWSAFFPLTVRTSAVPHFTRGRMWKLYVLQITA